MQDRRAVLLAQLDRTSGFIPRAEAKVTALLPVAIAMMGVVAVKVPMDDPVSWRAFNAGVATVCLAICLYRIYRTVFPQLRAPRASLIFFGEISKRDEQSYMDAVKQLTDDQLVDDVASQVWRNAEIVTAKFRHAKAAYHALAAALPFWLVFLVLVTLKDGKVPFGGH